VKAFRRIVLCLALMQAFSSSTFAAPPDRPVTIKAFGLWTLKRLGYHGVDFSVEPRAQRKTVTFRFRLPRGARQGPRNWYLTHLHFRIAFSRHSGSGRAYVEALTDGRGSAQIRFDVVRVGSHPVITSDSLGLVAGHVVKTSGALIRTMTFDNYNERGGVTPGINTLTLELEQYGDVRVDSLRFLQDTGIRYSPYSPARISLGVRVDHQRVIVKQLVKLNITVRNSGESTVKGGIVALDFSDNELQADRSTAQSLPTLRGGSSVEETFYLRPLEPGLHQAYVEARAGLSRPVVPLRILAVPRSTGSSGGSRGWWWWLVPAVIASGAAAAIAFARLGRLFRAGNRKLEDRGS
jgi:hypothetical protein